MIPLHTTTISVVRPDQDGTKDDGELTWGTVAGLTGVRAVISRHSGAETATGGSSEQVTARLDCDPIPLAHDDLIGDETTWELWEVTWTRRRIGMGLDHTVAELLMVTDRAAV